MDYAQEQADELTALESIFIDELEILKRDPICYNIHIVSEESPSADDPNLTSKVTLNITYTATYPEEGPNWKLIDMSNISDELATRLDEVMLTTIEENLGMGMAFAMQAALKEAVDDYNAENRDAAVRERQAQKEAEEQAELERLTAGTLLTPETFDEWNTAFIEEQRAKRDQKAAEAEGAETRKLTGREIFEQYRRSGKTYEEGDDGKPLGIGEDEPAQEASVEPIDVAVFSGLDDLDDLDLDELDLED
ncbi:uncharacterized protein MONBRDRAFT_30818 [Monosiga brevicollis MX1]|uniref:RWD domain-containing protein n=1 Tax=Monosiga brevicollis TaxID=81824 RepID=A9UPG5_MONBE|nr:uncharacterized protein MONBRDRAFT_30818 [Monosiga brevicollis MX1]EDQ92417.1 predicted protein [Monosiga brevicollis MX1]|eukprot:XP_001742179.1 hypothetical protein [Monosiga brevicollis MX1]